MNEILILDAPVLDQLRMKEVDPLAIGGMRNLSWVAAIPAEKRAILGYIEVNRPLVALQNDTRSARRCRHDSLPARSLLLWASAGHTRSFCRPAPRTRGRRFPCPWFVCGLEFCASHPY